MATIRKTEVTRRGFMQLGSTALVAGGVLNSANAIHTTGDNVQLSKSDSALLQGKIALEEHFDFSATENSSYASFGKPEFQRQIQDLGGGRIAEMDRGGVEVCILSLVGPGIQAIPNPVKAVEVAQRANDHLAARGGTI